MKALRFERSEVRYAAANVTSRFRPGSGAKVSPLRLVDTDPPEPPFEGWVPVWPRLTGICGSDLSTVEGHSSRYFEEFITFPFVPGHEVVGELADGSRVAIEPVLGHEARGFEPPFPGAAPGDGDDYRHLVAGPLEPGIQIGSCESTGGGWATQMIAHRSQLHPVPDDMTDERAVMLEPAAGGVHAALRGHIGPDDVVAVQGAGTMGLVTIAAIRHLCPPAHLIAAARYPVQRELAKALGADEVVDPGELPRAVRRATGCFVIGDNLSGGADVVIDAIGSGPSLQQAIGITRPRGRVVLLGMPAGVSLNLTGLWHRETELVGAYTYGTETLPDGRTTTSFALAFELVAAMQLERLVSAAYPLDRWQDALAHAAEAGPRGAVKVCFDLRQERHRGLPR
jgi:threonine dehydrogenase-like Zn-dependent dehydrogenase